MKKPPMFLSRNHSGFTVLEVVVALFIFGIISTSLFYMMGQTDRLRGRARYVELATQLAADEAERLRNTAAQYAQFEDSSYTTIRDAREFTVERTVVVDEEHRSIPESRLEPVHVTISVSSTSDSKPQPLVFNLLIGSDEP